MSALAKVSLIIMIVVSPSSCASNKNIDTKLDYWKENLESNIPVGTSKDIVDKYLKESGFEFKYFETEKTYST